MKGFPWFDWYYSALKGGDQVPQSHERQSELIRHSCLTVLRWTRWILSTPRLSALHQKLLSGRRSILPIHNLHTLLERSCDEAEISQFVSVKYVRALICWSPMYAFHSPQVLWWILGAADTTLSKTQRTRSYELSEALFHPRRTQRKLSTLQSKASICWSHPTSQNSDYEPAMRSASCVNFSTQSVQLAVGIECTT